MCTQIFSEGTPFYPFYPLEKSLAQVIEVSVQGSVEAPPAIDAGQAPPLPFSRRNFLITD